MGVPASTEHSCAAGSNAFQTLTHMIPTAAPTLGTLRLGLAPRDADSDKIIQVQVVYSGGDPGNISEGAGRQGRMLGALSQLSCRQLELHPAGELGETG